MEPKTKKIIITSLIVILLGAGIFFAGQWITACIKLKKAESQINNQELRGKVLYFGKLFVDKFLLSSGTVNFNDRLSLENAVRDINNEKIYEKWQSFTESADDQAAQKNAGELMYMLLQKINGELN